MQNNCLNCNTEVTGANYCSSCGQSTKHERLEVPIIVDEFTHAVLHTDRSILRLIPDLAYKPGIVAREYVEGKRKSLYNPFNFLVLIIALSSFMILASGINVFNNAPANDPILTFAQKHFNIVIFLTVPLLIFSTWLFIRKQGFNLAECAVLAAYTSGFRSLIHATLFVPFQYFFPQYYTIGLPVYMILYFCYYAMSVMQFTGKKTLGMFFKGFFSGVVMQVILTLFFSIAFTIYYFFLVDPKV